MLAQIPAGAWADRYSRRTALVVSCLAQAAAYAVWIAAPGLAGYAAGFVLWGVGGALASGAFEALLYDGLAAQGEAHRYASTLGMAEAAALAVQVPIAVVATGLLAAGGYGLVGAVSVAVCLAAAGVAATLRDVRVAGPDAEGAYLATLTAGLAASVATGPVRRLVLALTLLTGLEGLEEVFPLLAAEWGVATAVIPLALVAVPLAGAVGSALGGSLPVGRAREPALLGALALAALLGALAVRHPAGIALLTLSYATNRLVLVALDARLQHRITGDSRATVTSVTALFGELASIALYSALAASV